MDNRITPVAGTVSPVSPSVDDPKEAELIPEEDWVSKGLSKEEAERLGERMAELRKAQFAWTITSAPHRNSTLEVNPQLVADLNDGLASAFVLSPKFFFAAVGGSVRLFGPTSDHRLVGAWGPLGQARILAKDHWVIRQLAATPDGKEIASVDLGGNIFLGKALPSDQPIKGKELKSSNGDALRINPAPPAPDNEEPADKKERPAVVATALQYVNGGSVLAIDLAGTGHLIPAKGEKVRRVHYFPTHTYELSVSPDGKIAAGGGSENISLSDSQLQNRVPLSGFQNQYITGFVFSQDGRFLAVGTLSQKESQPFLVIQGREVRTDKEIFRIDPNDGSMIATFQFVAGSPYLLTLDNRGRIHGYDTTEKGLLNAKFCIEPAGGKMSSNLTGRFGTDGTHLYIPNYGDSAFEMIDYEQVTVFQINGL